MRSVSSRHSVALCALLTPRSRLMGVMLIKRRRVHNGVSYAKRLLRGKNLVEMQ